MAVLAVKAAHIRADRPFYVIQGIIRYIHVHGIVNTYYVYMYDMIFVSKGYTPICYLTLSTYAIYINSASCVQSNNFKQAMQEVNTLSRIELYFHNDHMYIFIAYIQNMICILHLEYLVLHIAISTNLY